MKESLLVSYVLLSISYVRAQQYINSTNGVQSITHAPTTSFVSIPTFTRPSLGGMDRYISREFTELSGNISSYCVSRELADYTSWYLRQPTAPPEITQNITFNDNVCTGCAEYDYNSSIPSTYKTNGEHTYTKYTLGTFQLYSVTASPPCCGACALNAGDSGGAQVIYWPTPNPYPNVTSIVNSDGFTFISPSPYVRFDSIAAKDLCGTVGPTIKGTTIGFPPSHLSTVRYALGNTAAVTYPFDFADLASCSLSTPSSELYKMFSSFTKNGTAYTWAPCMASIAFPSEINQLNSAWTSCAPSLQVSGPWDPPRALIPGADPATTPTSVPTQPPAAPSQPPASIASATVAPVITSGAGPTIDPSNAISSEAGPSSQNPPSTGAALPPAGSTKQLPSIPAALPPAGSTRVLPSLYPESASSIAGPDTAVNPTVPVRPFPASSALPAVPNPGSSADPSTQNGFTVPINPPATNSQLTILGQSIAIPVIGASNVVIGSVPVGANSPPITVNGVPVSLGSSAIVIGSSTVSLSSNQPQNPNVPIFGGVTASVLPTAVVTGSQTITSGQPMVTVAGNTVSLGSAGLVFGSTTILPSEVIGSPVDVGGVTVAAAPSRIDIGGQTITAGQPAAVISGTPVSLGSAGFIVGSRTVNLAPVAASPLVVGSITASQIPSGVVVGSQTIASGQPGLVISGTTISVGPVGLVVGSSTVALAPLSHSPMVFGGLTASQVPSGVVVGSQTITSGQPPVTILGTPASVGSAGLVIGSSSIPLGTVNQIATVAGHVITTAGPSGNLAVDGTTLYPGGQAVTIAGTPLSLGSAGLLVGSATVPLPQANLVATIAGHIITAAPSSGLYAIDGTIISPSGSPITIPGTPVSAAPNGALVVGFSMITPSSSPATNTITVDGQIFQINPSNVVIGTNTLIPGSAITVSATLISLGISDLVVGTVTETFTTAPTGGLGGAIISGLRGAGNGSVQTYTGAATGGKGGSVILACVLGALFAVAIPMISE